MKKLFLLFIFITNFVYANEHFTRKDIEDAAHIYGFYIGQNYSLEKISEKYPNLKPHTKIAQIAFDNEFRKTIENIDQEVRSINKLEWEKIKKKIRSEINQYLSIDSLSMQEAMFFIDEVKKRANGEIPRSTLEKFLRFNPLYQNNPELEFADGYTYVYENNGLGKAKGIPFKIKLPISWKAEDGNRPNIVQKFTNQNGKGFAMFMVMIKHIPYDGKITRADIEELIESEDIKSFVPNDGLLLDKGYLQLEQQPGFWMKSRIETIRGKNKILLDSITYNIFHNGKVISLQGQVANEINGKNIGYTLEKFEKLFELIINTFVLPDLYK